MEQTLNKDFLLEFFKCSLISNSMLETGMQFLNYEFLPDKSHKLIWKSITDHYRVHSRPPTIGVLAQMLSDKPELLSLLSDIKSVGMPSQEDLLDQLEQYIKNAKFQIAYDVLYNLFIKGEKQETYVQMAKFATEINSFSIRSQYFEKVFGGVHNRLAIREAIAVDPGSVANNFKTPFGIDELDFCSRGGLSQGDTACFLAQSGVGKSKILKHIGIHNARLGYNVAHFQFEGTKDECNDLYDAAWTGITLGNLEQGIVSEEQKKKIDKIVSDLRHTGGEIYVESFEQFGSASLVDVRNSLIELEKMCGKIHLVLIDYLEKVEPGDGKRYTVDQEKQRREAISQKMKNIAVEFKTRVITATQAHGIEKKLLDTPTFVMDRFNTSMGKNLLDPFSFFISMNQTEDEKTGKIMRLYCDKIRRSASKQVIYISQDYDKEKFYDRQKTIERFFKPQS